MDRQLPCPAHRSSLIALMTSRIPLAWLNLTHDRRRFALSLAGVGFAVVLMFIEMGFYNALLDATVALIDRFDADLVLVSASKTSLQALGTVPRRRLVQARGVAGVESVTPLYLERIRSVWHRPRDGRRVVRVLGVDPDEPALNFDELHQHAGALRLPNRVL